MKQLTVRERAMLEAYLQCGKKMDEIATLLGVHRSTIYRELQRNRPSPTSPYCAVYAQQCVTRRQQERPRRTYFTENMREVARSLLVNHRLSPEQITGRCRLRGEPMVSHERLYQWIWKDKREAGILYLYLRRQDHCRQRRMNTYRYRSAIPNRMDISLRPEEANKRLRFGDLEIDTLAGRKRGKAVLTINDRRSLFLWTALLPERSPRWVALATIRLLMPYKGLIHTITSDNGREFSDHELISKALDVKFYFASPFKAWQRGSNENLNGLLRQYIPRGSAIGKLTHARLQQITDEINNRPRKTLGFFSPKEFPRFPMKVSLPARNQCEQPPKYSLKLPTRMK